jgi:hypothetical protein
MCRMLLDGYGAISKLSQGPITMTLELYAAHILKHCLTPGQCGCRLLRIDIPLAAIKQSLTRLRYAGHHSDQKTCRPISKLVTQ